MRSDVNVDEIRVYSNDMRCLVKLMLEKNPDLRPTTKEILENKLLSDKIMLVSIFY
jgi:hypothetical protein